MSFNDKFLTIDCDRADIIVGSQNAVTKSLNLYRTTEYVLKINCMSNSYDTNVVSFNATSDVFQMVIGEINTAPIVIEANVASWNNTSDWSIVNPATGTLSVRINTSGAAILNDMGNASSKEYISEIWLTNNVGSDVLVTHSRCYLNNVPEP